MSWYGGRDPFPSWMTERATGSHDGFCPVCGDSHDEDEHDVCPDCGEIACCEDTHGP